MVRVGLVKSLPRTVTEKCLVMMLLLVPPSLTVTEMAVMPEALVIGIKSGNQRCWDWCRLRSGWGSIWFAGAGGDRERLDFVGGTR